jgi:Tfp pilus assembly protein PilF
MAKAVKKIKKSIEKAPKGAKDPDNWIIWGLILRYNGNYKSSRHKFLKALKVDHHSETAQ